MEAIKAAAESISVVHENIPMILRSLRAHDLLLQAEEIEFLGFGYHPTNMKRLGGFNLSRQGRSVFQIRGTAYGLFDAERTRATTLFRVTLPLEMGGPDEDVPPVLCRRV